MKHVPVYSSLDHYILAQKNLASYNCSSFPEFFTDKTNLLPMMFTASATSSSDMTLYSSRAMKSLISFFFASSYSRNHCQGSSGIIISVIKTYSGPPVLNTLSVCVNEILIRSSSSFIFNRILDLFNLTNLFQRLVQTFFPSV